MKPPPASTSCPAALPGRGRRTFWLAAIAFRLALVVGVLGLAWAVSALCFAQANANGEEALESEGAMGKSFYSGAEEEARTAAHAVRRGQPRNPICLLFHPDHLAWRTKNDSIEKQKASAVLASPVRPENSHFKTHENIVI
jgi:hypothetical protein